MCLAAIVRTLSVCVCVYVLSWCVLPRKLTTGRTKHYKEHNRKGATHID